MNKKLYAFSPRPLVVGAFWLSCALVAQSAVIKLEVNAATDYHGGERYPALERDPSKPDVLAEILKPRSGSH